MSTESRTRRYALWAALTVLLVVWLNQSVPLGDFLGIQARVYVTHTATLVEKVRYPFTFLYRRAFDEELYFNLAGAMLGRKTDAVALAFARYGASKAFTVPPPPADGHLHAPYTEVPIEYPPLMLPFILAPRLLTDSLVTYCRLFGAIMGLCLLASFWALMRARALRLQPSVLWLGAALLLHGAIAIQRLDAVPALLLALAAAAYVRARKDSAALWLGLAGAAKFLPFLFALPIAAIALASEGGLRIGLKNAARFIGIATLALALGLAPFWAFSPHAMRDVLTYHSVRGLHGESFFGALYAGYTTLLGTVKPAAFNFGSFNLSGQGADALAKLLSPLLMLSFAALSVMLVRKRNPSRPADIEWLFLLGLGLLWTFGKVFSPQYLTWALPFVPFLATRRAWPTLGALFGLLAISQIYFRGYFDAIYMMQPLGVATLLVRNMLLTVLVVSAAQHVLNPSDVVLPAATL